MNYKNTNSSFYQLTPDILMEFIHFNVDNMTTSDLKKLGYECPNFTGNYYDIENKLNIYKNTETYTKYLILNPINEIDTNTKNCEFNSSLNYDNSEVKYVKLQENQYLPYYYTKTEVQTDDSNKDLIYDIVVIHFTNGNYMSNYDGFIFNINVLDNLNNKIYLSSVEFKKDDTPEFEDSPLLIAEKLYTTKFQFRIPNIEAVEKLESIVNQITDNNGLKENTPLNISLKAIKKTYNDVTSNTIYETEELTNINVPYIDRFQSINVSIQESTDGDYFTIDAEAKNQSLSDYLFTHGLTNVTIMHDLTVTEHYYDINDRKVKNEVTRREYFIVGINDGQGDSVDDTIYYRPIVTKENVLSFTIQDTLRIYNNVDQTTIVKVGTLDYGTGENQSVYKYGKFIERIADPGVFQVKVFNKRKDVNDTEVKIVNTSSQGFNSPDRVAVTKFIDAKNIAVSVSQVTLSE